MIASAFLGLAIWTENNVFGYPAFVAGLFCIASLGIVFPAVGRAVQGFLALLMWTGLWMMATTEPIALFLALSHWMLDQLPLALQIGVRYSRRRSRSSPRRRAESASIRLSGRSAHSRRWSTPSTSSGSRWFSLRWRLACWRDLTRRCLQSPIPIRFRRQSLPNRKHAFRICSISSCGFCWRRCRS